LSQAQPGRHPVLAALSINSRRNLAEVGVYFFLQTGRWRNKMSGMIGGDARQMQAFHDRISRIEAKAAKGTQTVHVGDDEMDLRELKRLDNDPALKRRRHYHTGMLWSAIAVISAATSVIAIRAVRADFFQALLTGTEAQSELITDLVLSLLAVLFIRQLFSLRWRSFVALQLPAVLAMVLGMHNLVHVAPQAFARVFPQPWVETVLATTEMNSVLLPGKSITF
jgi:hypothetical protein